jgi:hypothetical protein
MPTHAELSALTSALDELTMRLTGLAEAADARHHEELAAELYGVERSLQGALRRLRRVVDTEERRRA